MKSEKRRLHIAYVLIEFIDTLRDLIIPLGIGFIAGLRHLTGYFGYLLLIPLALLSYDFIKWLRFSYEISAENFHLQSGVLIRNDRYIRIPRIQSVQIQTNVLLRLFGLVQLKLDTADPANKGDVTLRVLSRREAERIQTALGHGRAGGSSPRSDAAIAEKIYPLSARGLLLAALTSSNIGIIGILLAIWSQADNFVPDNFWGTSLRFFRHLPPERLIALIAAVVLLLWLMSLAVTFIRWGGFQLTVGDGQWHVHKGILQTIDNTYKTDRVQAIRIVESPLQQLFGLCSVYAECSGSVDEKNDGDGSVLVYPLMKKRQLTAFLAAIIPRFAGAGDVRPLPTRGILYNMAEILFFWTIVCTVLSYFFAWGKWCWLALPPLAVFLWLRRRSEGFCCAGNRIVFIHCFFAKKTIITLKKHIQTLSKKQSVIQRLLRLGSCELSIRSSSAETYAMEQLQASDAAMLFRWFRRADSTE